MEMTKQRKMLIGVLCVGIGGLAVDRFVLSTPQSASADDEVLIIESPDAPPPPLQPSAPGTIVPGAGEPDEGGADAATLPSYASLTERLVKAQALQGQHELAPESADPFRVPDQWQAEKSAPQNEEVVAATPSGQRLKAVVKLDGTVRSVIDGKEELMAVITGGSYKGRAVRIGQKVRIPIGNEMYEEYELVEVGARYVVWRSAQTQQTIEMRVAKVL